MLAPDLTDPTYTLFLYLYWNHFKQNFLQYLVSIALT